MASSSRYIDRPGDSVINRIRKAKEEEDRRLDADVQEFLRGVISAANDRNTDLTRDRLDSIVAAVGEVEDVETLLFGGSVAKHTYIDGLSDIDTLVILDRDDTRGLGSVAMLEKLSQELSIALSGTEVEDVRAGDMAITVQYSDGIEIQVLPCVRDGEEIRVPNPSGEGWVASEPKKFAADLTSANREQAGNLVPAIKLVKSLTADLPEQQRISGYHIEALSVEAANSLTSPLPVNKLVVHLLNFSSERILKPIEDRTGQSQNVDDSLGVADSAERKLRSTALTSLARRLDVASSVAQWRSIFEGDV